MSYFERLLDECVYTAKPSQSFCSRMPIKLFSHLIDDVTVPLH